MFPPTTCHMSRVTCHMSSYQFFLIDKIVKLVGGGYVLIYVHSGVRKLCCKNPAYGRQSILQPIQIVVPIPKNPANNLLILAVWGLARYRVHTTATWDQFCNIIKNIRNHSDGMFLFFPWLIESRSYRKSSLEHHTSRMTHHTSHIT